MRWVTAALLGLALAAVLACGILGGPPGPGHCKIRVVSVEQWDIRTGAADVSYRVAGEAGSPAAVWLAAKVGENRYLSGGPVEVGPGPFQAIVGLKLTGLPREFVAVLEVYDPTRIKPPRCRADAKMPSY